MGENVDPKWIEMAYEWSCGDWPKHDVASLAALLSRVDAEATERAAKVCDGLEAAFIRSDEVQLASVAGACAEDIRSTLARKEADHAEG